jgi:hypothetical protein
MFIIDCTASMDPWIEVCKEEIRAITNFVVNKFDMIKVRVSIIGYRDYNK